MIIGADSDRSTVSKTDPIAPLLAALRDLMAWLQAEDVRALIIGGVAASLLGRPRLTQDVDVLVMLDRAQRSRFLASAPAFNFEPRVGDPLGLARRTRVLLVRHRPTAIDVDVVFGALPFEQEALARARPMTAGGVTFPVVTPEDLVVMKMVAHRPQDLLDVEAVLEIQPRLDLRRVRRWLREFSTALEMPELRGELEAMLTRRRRRSPRSEG